ncbi:hypothetical protein A3A76_04370 [Candidatus Woesebacteria bacterium RIFCSPLOWO2_01_FULL_39_23]|uniref:CMP/dCMP-type deaminase domain-containing protein n=1 Tax=Candidatus Woesebacteria bacterium RIFCSPHIGHO2_01_FULL_40_22 TaxID=1802499 RepID=A0A1F7YF78_9BACT|nr:MAG: hypothetical protein A2141_01935 [Candidatus Woesebacteria bacterium RBG_16_40_11]OGM25986.1 MAG: hypothetical protein A2628_00370 [Candidatus Woesebacteria bacterium RIFCSPHIGHO2_01_FULL_40_22]OGM38098.1 MAG: hypothetical protein A3E41_03455 [Candidatus Woesebacteria bacterium RIFCSPHIGHO2_12_FULL_38_9]OGM61835.1 MAG: hypothetical protein A3A76_04370 [Candidatus Woesebacteria bacterium RIFCSPLOWO2_01_FULL_39_23]
MKNHFSEKKLRYFIGETIKEAQIAVSKGNYPIGSLIVDEKGNIIAKCQNENATRDDITAHAEVLCLRKMGSKRLAKENGKSYYLFSSLEPCGGCGFFMARTNIKIVYIASLDPYRSGMSVLKKSTDFSEIFKNINVVVCDFLDLATKSKLLMRDYLIKKGKKEAAKIYE